MRQPAVFIALAFTIAACAIHQEPGPGTPTKASQLATLAHAVAIVRYFHPSDAAFAADWNNVTPHLVQQVLDAESPLTARQLSRLLSPWSTARQIPCDQPLSSNHDSPESVRWVHKGPGRAIAGLSRTYKSCRTNLGDATCDELAATIDTDLKDSWAVVEVDQQECLAIPLTIALSDLDNTSAPPPMGNHSAKAVRIADVISAWGVLRHFYPYRSVVTVDWDMLLEESLVAALSAETDRQHRHIMLTLLEAIEDGHAVFQAKSTSDQTEVSVRGHLVSIGGDPVVWQASGNSGLESGDRILLVDGVSARDLLERKRAEVSGSSQWKDFLALQRLLKRPKGGDLPVRIERDGAILDVQTSVGPFADPIRQFTPRIPKEIAYLPLTGLSNDKLVAALPRLRAAQAIVFDMRGYPGPAAYTLLPMLIEAAESARWMHVPLWTRPYQDESVDYTTLGWNLKPDERPLTQPVAFLTNAAAISYGESILGYVEGQNLGPIFGSDTAGANGNVATHALPSGGQIRFTGMKVTRHDGRQLHNLGVPPTYSVDITLDGIRNGRDEVLDAAIEWLGVAIRNETATDD